MLKSTIISPKLVIKDGNIKNTAGQEQGAKASSQDNEIDVCMDYIRKVSEGASVTEGFRFRNPSDEAVADWLVRIGVARQEKGQEE